MQSSRTDSPNIQESASAVTSLSQPEKVGFTYRHSVRTETTADLPQQPHGETSISREFLFVLFTLSGFSGLIYESIWTHYLKLFLGHAAYAQSLVLMIFMGGMAIGSWLTARHCAKWRNLLVAYAIVEGLVGLCALGFHLTFTTVTEFAYTSLLPSFHSATAATICKWSVATALILPQSILLGMTFPLMSGGLLRRFPEQSGSTVSMLYFANSIGAVVGILTSGFVLISLVGLPGTMLTAGLINLTLALIIWLFSKGEVERSFENHTSSPSLVATQTASPLLLLTVAVITGASSFMYEVGWIRMLSLVLGSSTHSFEIMLSAFILGLAFGGLWIEQRIDHIKNQIWFLGLVQVAMGLLALSTLPLYGHTFEFMSFIIEALKRNEAGYLLFNLSSHVVSSFIMLPVTFCAGMTLPLLTTILLRSHHREKAIGHVYAANTIGAIVGVFLAVHGLIPTLGLKGTVSVGALLDIIVGWGLLWMAVSIRQRRAFFGIVAASSAMLLYVVGAVQLDPYQMGSGVYRYGWAAMPRENQILFHRDGKTATITLHREKNGKVIISTNGKPDATIAMATGQQPTSDEATMATLAAVALGFNFEAKTAANIGMGSGMTAHTLLGSPFLQQLDTIEIEPAMVAAAYGFRPRVEAVFTDPRSHIHFEDAKSFFSTRRQQYDIIISEPSNPWVSGVSGLFSKEFYHSLKNYLQPEGVLVQWIQQYEFTVELFASIVSALDGDFSDYAIFSANDVDIVLVAKKEGKLGQLDGRLFSPGILAEDLVRVALKGLPDLEIRRIGARQELRPLFQTLATPANSDYYPYVDQHAPKARFTGSDARLLTSFGLAPLPLLEMLGQQGQWLGQPITPTSNFTRAQLVIQAKAIRAALLNDVKDSDHIEFKEQALATLLSLPLSQCQNPAIATMWHAALFNTAKVTLPYLLPQELEPVWQKIALTACVQTLPSEYLQWLSLLRAVGNRDARNMASYAASLLEHPQERKDRERYRYLAAVQLLGLLHQGKQQEALAVWEKHAPAFQGEESYLSLLASHSRLLPLDQ